MEDKEVKLCGAISEPKCGRTAQVRWPVSRGVEIHLCLTHLRIILVGEFGERAVPPLTREQARNLLIDMDGLNPEEAEARVNKHFSN
jgi:hypothetical protein